MNELYRKNESETNEAVARTVLIFFGMILIVGVFCWLNIFDIFPYMINGFILAALIPLLLPTVLVFGAHGTGPWIKYVILACVSVVTGIAYVVFTFQTVIIFVVPSIIAVFYLDRRVMGFTGGLTVAVIAAAHMVTAFHLFQPWIEPFTGLKAIMLYGALPRIMQYLCCHVILYFLYRRFSGFLGGMTKVMDEQQTGSSQGVPLDSTVLEAALGALTERERDVFGLMVRGFTNGQIADQLCLSGGTVKNYVSAIYDKLENRDRTALILKYSPYYRDHDQSHTQ